MFVIQFLILSILNVGAWQENQLTAIESNEIALGSINSPFGSLASAINTFIAEGKDSYVGSNLE